MGLSKGGKYGSEWDAVWMGIKWMDLSKML